MRYYLADVDIKFYERYQQIFGKKTKANILIAYSYKPLKPKQQTSQAKQKTSQSKQKMEEQIIYYINERKRGNINSLMIDSGTYSLRDKTVDKEYEKEYGDKSGLKGEIIKADSRLTFEQHFYDYMEFIKKHGNDLDYFIAWDRDFRRSDEAVKNNIKWLEMLEEQQEVKELKKLGIRPIPVIHHPDYYGKDGQKHGVEPQHYLDEKYPVIAYGGASDTKDIPTHVDTDWVQIMINNSGLRCHQLGCASVDQLIRLPIHSCDSTTWKQDVFRARKVKFKVNDEDKKIHGVPIDMRNIDVISLKSFDSKSNALQTAFLKYLKETIKIDPDEFFVDEDYDNNETIAAKKVNQHVVSMYYYINVFPRHISQYHQINGWDTSWPEDRSK
jgi:hypothetical protein